MKFSKRIVLFAFFSFVLNSLLANNLQIKNAKIVEKNTTSGYMKIGFDLSWENSWRLSTTPNNYDAVWIFAKYRIGKGEWKHCNVSIYNGNYVAAEGSSIETVSDGKGFFVYRSDNGVGNVDFTGMQLHWDYKNDGVNDTDIVKVQLFGIEMVRVNDGSFYIGDFDGTNESISAFHGSDGNPVFVWEQIVQNISVDVNNYDDDSLETGIGILGIEGLDTNNDGVVDKPDYPTGYFGFYAMKYEISQNQYIAFLNTLNRAQQNERTQSDINQLSITNRFVMSNSSGPIGRNAIACDKEQENLTDPIIFYSDLNDNAVGDETYDGADIACNYLSWADGAAYADWAGLRPMTELEYEKAARGTLSPHYSEYAWGDASICTQNYGLSSAGSSLETLYLDSDNGNALYNATTASVLGPFRCGIFAQGATNRKLSGAGYYGIMELSGNVIERVVSLGNITGRNFRATLGDGELSTQGNATNTDWPGLDATASVGITGADGSGFRGGSLVDAAQNLAISFRQHGAFSYAGRNISYGFRAVR